jgi:hypothetical protein
MRRVAAVAILVAVALALPESGVAEGPPVGAKRVFRYQTRADAARLKQIAKVYALTAERMNAQCSAAETVLRVLDNVRVENAALGHVISAAKYILQYAHVVLGVDSSCDAAKTFSWAAINLATAAARVFPSCVPRGNLDLSCSWSYGFETAIYRRSRTGLDVCYWKLDRFNAGTVRYLEANGRCR